MNSVLSPPFILGLLIGTASFFLFHRLKTGGFQALSREILHRAEKEVEARKAMAEMELKEASFAHQRKLEQLWQDNQKKIHKEEERLIQREDKLEARMSLVEKKLSDIEKREFILSTRREKLEEEKKELLRCQEKIQKELETTAGLNASQAKAFLLQKVEEQIKKETAQLTWRLKSEAEENAEREASKIIASAINRMAVSCVSDLSITTVALPSEEMKGRIIGREGRNIRTLEQATGVNFLIDDTPNAIVISGFDPVRKHIAKLALSELIKDGRIHPTRIEESVEWAKATVEKKIRELGEDASMRAGVMNLHPELLVLLGKLHFRYSLGQNILEHSIEVSYLLGLMAAELGLDSGMAKRIGLLHDMGKAVSHEMEGSHAMIGYDLALKYGEKLEVANGIGCHHDEIPPMTIEGSLCSAADAISGARPGARNEAFDQYVKRLRKLETLSCQYQGVVKAYVLQAGREVRVVVEPDELDDADVIDLARKLAHQIERELSYPGRIKVTVIREKRAIEYAS